jgi:hypothetical protein
VSWDGCGPITDPDGGGDYRLVWTAVANKQPIEATYQGRRRLLVVFVKLSMPRTAQRRMKRSSDERWLAQGAGSRPQRGFSNVRTLTWGWNIAVNRCRE